MMTKTAQVPTATKPSAISRGSEERLPDLSWIETAGSPRQAKLDVFIRAMARSEARRMFAQDNDGRMSVWLTLTLMLIAVLIMIARAWLS
jgi:hypothetical protein